MVGAEHLDAVGVGSGLILTGEVEVDIRNLIAAEAEERFKRNVEPVFIELRAALGADRVRQIRAAGAVVRHLEGGKLALGTPVVRREGVDLRNARHKSDNGRAD